MFHTCIHRRKLSSPLASIGLVLCFLAAVACVIQPGGRKLRYTGPCGKDLCLCQIPLFESNAATPPAEFSDTTANNVGSPQGHLCFEPAQSTWGFVSSGSTEPRTVYMGSTLFVNPACTEVVLLDCFSAVRKPDFVSFFTEPCVRKNDPPPKFSA